MANDEHVALLKQGVDAWNKWRDKNPNIRPDFRESNLTGADLRGVTSGGRASRERTLAMLTSEGSSLAGPTSSARTFASRSSTRQTSVARISAWRNSAVRTSGVKGEAEEDWGR